METLLRHRLTQAIASAGISTRQAATVGGVTPVQMKKWKLRMSRFHEFLPGTMKLIEQATIRIEEFAKLDQHGKELLFPQIPPDQSKRGYLHKAPISMSTEAWLKLESLRGNLRQGEYLERLVMAVVGGSQ